MNSEAALYPWMNFGMNFAGVLCQSDNHSIAAGEFKAHHGVIVEKYLVQLFESVHIILIRLHALFVHVGVHPFALAVLDNQRHDFPFSGPVSRKKVLPSGFPERRFGLVFVWIADGRITGISAAGVNRFDGLYPLVGFGRDCPIGLVFANLLQFFGSRRYQRFSNVRRGGRCYEPCEWASTLRPR